MKITIELSEKEKRELKETYKSNYNYKFVNDLLESQLLRMIRPDIKKKVTNMAFEIMGVCEF